MAETIDWSKYHREEHVLAWILTEMVSAVGVENFDDFDASELEIEMTINGVEVPFEEVMQPLQCQLSRLEADAVERGAFNERERIIQKLAMLVDPKAVTYIEKD